MSLQNPYAAPPQPSNHAGGGDAWKQHDARGRGGPADPSQVGGPKIFGVLSIVFASIMLLFSLLGACSGALGGSMSSFGSRLGNHSKLPASVRAKQQALLETMGTVYKAFAVESLMFLAMSGWLLALGIGQMRYRAWARRGTVAWSFAAFAVLVSVILIAVLWIAPAYQRMFDELARNTPSGTLPSQLQGWIGSMVGGTSTVLTLLIYSPYPIILLVYFTRQRVKDVMTA